MSQPSVASLAYREIVTDEDADTALHELLDTVGEIAEARGDEKRLEAMLRHVKAVQTAFSSASSFQARENDGYASKDYAAAIDAYRGAVVRHETIKAKRENAFMVLEMWRTIQASKRQKL